VAVFALSKKQFLSALTLSLALAPLGACGSHEASGDPLDPDDTQHPGDDPDDDGGEQDGLSDAGSESEHEAGEIYTIDAHVATLTLDPQNPQLDVTGGESMLKITAMMDGAALPKASFSIDNPHLGTIAETGVFRASGTVAGTAKITARYGTLVATTVVRVIANLTHTASGVSDTQKAAIDAAASAGSDANFKWLYPYDGTVFPRGLAGPDMQFGGAAGDALRVAIKMGDFTFKGYFAGAAPLAVTLPQPVWEGLTRSASGMDSVSVEVTKLAGSSVVGPIRQTWRIAPADLKGVIYYNTYKSASTNLGAVMRIRPGKDAQAEVMIGNCTVCHSVSAQGNVLAAGLNWGSDNPVDSATFDLYDDGDVVLRRKEDDGRKFAFGALTPDGRYLLSNGVPDPAPMRGVKGPVDSKLWDTKTGLEVAAPALTNKLKYAVTPAFSPDEKRVAFSLWDTTKGKTLAMMDVDLSMNPPAFAAPQTVTTVAQGVVGWPSFLSDGKGIVYQEGEKLDTAGYGGVPIYADLRLADTAGATVRKLDALNGWKDASTSYLPYGKDEENRRNYEPSVLPVPVGGYYWVIFTSRRAYGHTLAPGGSVAGSDDEWGKLVGKDEVPSVRKKLWIAAIDIDYSGKIDPSHPAFYLPGQELNAGNMRAYTSLEPCHKNGDSCQSGADCCGGFCRWQDTGDASDPVATCVPPPVGCSNVDESCLTNADCCGAQQGETCINKRCASPNVYLQ
jgi:hypothetical protein